MKVMISTTLVVIVEVDVPETYTDSAILAEGEQRAYQALRGTDPEIKENPGSIFNRALQKVEILKRDYK